MPRQFLFLDSLALPLKKPILMVIAHRIKANALVHRVADRVLRVCEEGDEFPPACQPLPAHPGDQAGSLKRYSFADTGLDEGALRERARPYQEFFGVETEQLS